MACPRTLGPITASDTLTTARTTTATAPLALGPQAADEPAGDAPKSRDFSAGIPALPMRPPKPRVSADGRADGAARGGGRLPSLMPPPPR